MVKAWTPTAADCSVSGSSSLGAAELEGAATLAPFDSEPELESLPESLPEPDSESSSPLLDPLPLPLPLPLLLPLVAVADDEASVAVPEGATEAEATADEETFLSVSKVEGQVRSKRGLVE